MTQPNVKHRLKTQREKTRTQTEINEISVML